MPDNIDRSLRVLDERRADIIQRTIKVALIAAYYQT